MLRRTSQALFPDIRGQVTELLQYTTWTWAGVSFSNLDSVDVKLAPQDWGAELIFGRRMHCSSHFS